mmetsp:Transcript_21731/g.30412  ORF Transcript_21731/g.30412 Transcript_21731/m.30412 type:complete len:219 (-) Transcript_21731:20-676(-)
MERVKIASFISLVSQACLFCFLCASVRAPWFVQTFYINGVSSPIKDTYSLLWYRSCNQGHCWTKYYEVAASQSESPFKEKIETLAIVGQTILLCLIFNSVVLVTGFFYALAQLIPSFGTNPVFTRHPILQHSHYYLVPMTSVPLLVLSITLWSAMFPFYSLKARTLPGSGLVYLVVGTIFITSCAVTNLRLMYRYGQPVDGYFPVPHFELLDVFLNRR